MSNVIPNRYIKQRVKEKNLSTDTQKKKVSETTIESYYNLIDKQEKDLEEHILKVNLNALNILKE